MEDEPRIAAWDAKVDWPLTGLTLVFLAGYAWQVLDTSLDPAGREALDLVLTGIWLLLGLDYLVRLGLARRKLALRAAGTCWTCWSWCCRCSGPCAPCGSSR